MKRRLSFTAVLLTMLASAVVAEPATVPAPGQLKIDPAKQVTVSLSVQDWQALLVSVQDSERVSARDANRIAQTILNQVRMQITPSLKK